MLRIYEDHKKRLPYVRIKKLTLQNIKNVEKGTIDFNCAKEFIPYDTKSDIMGIYGQNGSGKTTLVQAIDMVKGIVSGYHLGKGYADYIDVAAEYGMIIVEFDFQYLDGTVATVSYEFKIQAIEKEKNSTDDDFEDEKKSKSIRIFDEVIKTDMYADGSIRKMHKIIDTGDKNSLLCTAGIENYYFDDQSDMIREDLAYFKRKTLDDSQSFVFCNATTEIMNGRNTEEDHSKYYEILAELNLYAEQFLFIVGTNSTGLVQLRAGIPIFIPESRIPILLKESRILEIELYKRVEKVFSVINMVIETVIPGLQLELETTATRTEKGEEGVYVKIFSVRGNRKFPFSYESDGVIKLVSIMACYVFAFSQGSATLVVDEIDSGVFEFMLGELLKVFEESGKGQLIFTSHNLRPLEVLDKKFIRFTTTNPKNRYYKIKGIGNTNNLRDTYLREIELGNGNVEIYSKTRKFKIANALRKAGKEVIKNVN